LTKSSKASPAESESEQQAISPREKKRAWLEDIIAESMKTLELRNTSASTQTEGETPLFGMFTKQDRQYIKLPEGPAIGSLNKNIIGYIAWMGKTTPGLGVHLSTEHNVDPAVAKELEPAAAFLKGVVLAKKDRTTQSPANFKPPQPLNKMELRGYRYALCYAARNLIGSMTEHKYVPVTQDHYGPLSPWSNWAEFNKAEDTKKSTAISRRAGVRLPAKALSSNRKVRPPLSEVQGAKWNSETLRISQAILGFVQQVAKQIPVNLDSVMLRSSLLAEKLAPKPIRFGCLWPSEQNNLEKEVSARQKAVTNLRELVKSNGGSNFKDLGIRIGETVLETFSALCLHIQNAARRTSQENNYLQVEESRKNALLIVQGVGQSTIRTIAKGNTLSGKILTAGINSRSKIVKCLAPYTEQANITLWRANLLEIFRRMSSNATYIPTAADLEKDLGNQDGVLKEFSSDIIPLLLNMRERGTLPSLD